MSAVQVGESHEPSSADAHTTGPVGPFLRRPMTAASGLVALAAVVTSALTSGAAGVLVAVVMLGGLVSWTDITTRRIPNRLVVATGLAGLGISLIDDNEALALGAAVFVGTAMLIVHLVDPEGLGFGDVKYAAALAGLLATTLSASTAVGVVMVACVAAAVAPVVIQAWRPAQRGVPLGALLSLVATVAVIVEVVA